MPVQGKQSGTTRQRFKRLRIGTAVKTTQANPHIKDWEKRVLALQKWGVKGHIVYFKCSPEHKSYYDVRHEDGRVAPYDPSEVEALKK